MMENTMIEVDVIETWWDYLLGISTMILTIINVWLIYIIYKWQHKDSNAIEERQRKVSQFNNIFLIPRIDNLKKAFDDLLNIAAEFETCTDDEDKKSEKSEKIEKKIVELDDNFVSFIAGIDSTLHKEVDSIIINMRDGLSHDIFDTNTKEITGAAYVQKIQKRISNSYKSLLKALFSYDGNLPEKTEKEKVKPTVYLYVLLTIIVLLLGTLVYHHYTTNAPEKVTIQLDETQMRSIIDAVHKDTTAVQDGQ